MCELVSIDTNYGEKVMVAAIKHDEITNIIKSASLCKNIDMLILFGSSLTKRCKDDSDIDIAVISKYTVYRLCKLKSFHVFIENIYSYSHEQSYDFLYYKSYDDVVHWAESELVSSEILNKGKIIYKRLKNDDK